MTDVLHLRNYSDAPIFTIKTVVHETGIAPATLRAWERRYGCLSPSRSEGGYRLYSERDIALLRWLKRQMDAGVSISRAVALLELRHAADDGKGYDDRAASGAAPRAAEGARATHIIADELLSVLLAFDEAAAEALLSEAFALHGVDIVAEDIIAPVLVEIGERWHRGEASVVQEHFATAFLRRRLTVLFQAYDRPANGPLAVTGSAPSEWHDVGILLVSIALRRQGWRVVYLGQNVPAERFAEQIRSLRPAVVCLSATTPASVTALAQVYEAVTAMALDQPRLFFGGRAFNMHPDLAHQFPLARVASSSRELLAHLSDEF